MTAEFKFKPRQIVRITLFGLNYTAQVLRCIYDGGPLIYNVEHAVDGDLKTREFYEDDLAEVSR